MDFGIGTTGVAQLHYSFVNTSHIDAAAERERILSSDKKMHKTPRVVNSTVQSKYEKRYADARAVFDELVKSDPAISRSDLIKQGVALLGISSVTLRKSHYIGRYARDSGNYQFRTRKNA